MSDQLQAVLDGQIGKFWPFDGRFGGKLTELHGYVRKLDVGTVQLEALDESDFLAQHGRPKPKIPGFAAGSTASSGILLVRRSGDSSKRVLAGSHTSVLKYRYRTVFAEVDLSALRTGHVSKVRAHFPEMLRWSGFASIESDREVDEENRIKGVTMRLTSDGEEKSFRIGDGITMSLSNDWNFHESGDQATLLAGLGAEVESRRPRPVSELIAPLIDVQLLLSTAHGGWVPCRSARARLDYSKDATGKHYCSMWDRDLMQVPAGAKDPALPFFYYSDLNKSDGLRRWLRLNREHGRFIRPATMRPLFAGMVETTKLMELYAAIEYYVAASKKARRKWAPRGRIRPAVALANHASTHFHDFVGDPTLWAENLHALYNRIKHEATDVDIAEAYWFAESARALIISISLDYATRRTSASKRFLSDHRMEYISEQLKSVM